MFSKSTVRLVVQFKDFDGNKIIPEDIKLIIYDSKQEIQEEISAGIVDNGNGNFYYDFVAPEHDYIFEYSGVYHSKPVLARQQVSVKFI